MIPGITAGGGGGSAPDLWTPAQIATRLWLDASDAASITLVSGAVGTWGDKSGNGFNFTSSAGTRPDVLSAAMNGLDVIDFVGGEFLTAASAVIGITNSMYIVFKPTLSANVGAIISQYNNTFPPGRMVVMANQLCTGVASSGRLSSFNASITNGACTGGGAGLLVDMAITDVPTLFEWIQTTGSENSKSYKNGTLVDSGTVTLLAAVTTQIARAQGAGGVGGNAPYDGEIAEIVIVASAQVQADREIMEGYLAHKWGFAANLPALHPYKTQPPTI